MGIRDSRWALTDWSLAIDGQPGVRKTLADWRDDPQLRHAVGPGVYTHAFTLDAPVAGARYLLDLGPVSYTHLRAHETVLDLVCRLLLEKKKI